MHHDLQPPAVLPCADQEDVWLAGVARNPSPNFNQRPEGVDVELLVIHNISLPPGEFSGNYIEQFFTNCLDHSYHPFFKEIEGIEVSAHLLVRRDGSLIQFVPLNQRAWHAGQSSFRGRKNCNDFSIGIELEGTDTCPYTDEQYAALAQVTGEIRQYYPKITTDNIAGHSEIAPGRKTDPGQAFDWARYRSQLKGI
ncbi:1,6-anhydro-N-acetylmuramyl-L-alanine amidase AmpD [Oceanospirillum linum]|uniref:1,6-anhydro-N-acetylmuramyl-L-alanine amidase AmpD n=1 Tax=Oceanospirillum linum TaxID=966 RepID=A0A1T1HB49_OCELI|nr:1,6-anhydro-N-acetylmuramyl-L-alanine amidase AmpD [Oceanospirillum linum]OOV86980.1 N-acetylmuramoyl-L-alanine amidase [Oceanospirillum linum]SEF70392.1 AmpD protein [Oleiphilus messinensis]SMP15289.1 AmpD protein [Oceanospirillum linum]